jgi:hypothetical protein
MKVHDEGHSAAVCIPKEPGEMSGRARGWGVPYVQGLLRNEQRATKRYWPWALPRIPTFLPPAHRRGPVSTSHTPNNTHP